MTEDEGLKEKPKRRRFLRIIPIPQRSRGLRVDEEFNHFQTALSRVRRTCPNDGSFLRIENVYDTDADYIQTRDGETLPAHTHPDPSLVCPQCGFTVRIETLIEEAQADAAHIKRSENQLVTMAFALGAGCALIAYLTSNLFLLVGGALFALSLFIRALLLRYRYWQAVNARMFESRPPFMEWLRYELRS